MVKLVIDVLRKPSIDDGFLKSPLIAQLGSRDFAFLRPCVNGLRLEAKVFGYLFDGHNVVRQSTSPFGSLLIKLFCYIFVKLFIVCYCLLLFYNRVDLVGVMMLGTYL